MIAFSDQPMKSLQKLVDDCDHILEEQYSEQELLEMRDTLEILRTQVEEYKQQLLDRGENSKSMDSRGMAKLFLNEENQLEELIRRSFPKAGEAKSDTDMQRELNLGALFVEYLTGRAMQSTREALIGAIHLKLLSEEDLAKGYPKE